MVTAGAIIPKSSIVLRGFEDISVFLTQLKEGKITITNAPISCNIKSYRFTLHSYPKSKDIFKISDEGAIALAPFGVPKGTIIAWYPDQGSMIKDPTTGEIKIAPPKGWAICDGNNNTPSLNGRFLRGGRKNSDVGQLGKADPNNPIHKHEFTSRSDRKGSDKDWGTTPWANGPNPIYELSINYSDWLPPYMDVIYLIKQ